MKQPKSNTEKYEQSQIRDLRKLRHMAMGYVQKIDEKYRNIIRDTNIDDQGENKPHPLMQLFTRFTQLIIRLIQTERKIMGEGPMDTSWFEEELKELATTNAI